MFTGIVEDLGTVVQFSPRGSGAQMVVRTALPAADFSPGDSVALNGACQTVERCADGMLTFYALRETLKKTNLKYLQAGEVVNLETALRLGGKLGGHLVSGHIDCTAPVQSIKERSGDIALTIARPPAAAFPVVAKGSIAINGVSLTIAELNAESVSVCIIPHTWQHTNLRLLKIGSEVNLEADLIGKYVCTLLEPYNRRSAVSMDDLRQAGF
ncbi:MAG: riboflavin synthase [Oligosphaeraceae bacterium]|nr:riboflavin synthase [Oligosphaeraceae bacterium]